MKWRTDSHSLFPGRGGLRQAHMPRTSHVHGSLTHGSSSRVGWINGRRPHLEHGGLTLKKDTLGGRISPFSPHFFQPCPPFLKKAMCVCACVCGNIKVTIPAVFKYTLQWHGVSSCCCKPSTPSVSRTSPSSQLKRHTCCTITYSSLPQPWRSPLHLLSPWLWLL